MRSAPIPMAAGLDVLVELAGEVEPLQHELERGRRRGRRGRAEPGDGRLERAERLDLADVLARRHRVGDGDDEPALERRDDLVELPGGEALVEHVQHRALYELAEHLVLALVAQRLEL